MPWSLEKGWENFEIRSYFWDLERGTFHCVPVGDCCLRPQLHRSEDLLCLGKSQALRSSGSGMGVGMALAVHPHCYGYCLSKNSTEISQIYSSLPPLLLQVLNEDKYSSTIKDKILTIDVRPGWRQGTRITFEKEGDQVRG